MLCCAISTEKKGHVNFWKKHFTDPIEKVYIIMKDSTIFNYTNLYNDRVYISIRRLEKTLKKFKNKNYSIKDVAIIIHNHFKGYKFSLEDYELHRRLKKYGFNGRFLLYSHMKKKVYDIED